MSCLFVNVTFVLFYILTDIHAEKGTSSKYFSPFKTFQVIEMIWNYKESEGQDQDTEKQLPGTVLFVDKLNLSKFNVDDSVWMKTGNGILKHNGKDVIQKVYYQSSEKQKFT